MFQEPEYCEQISPVLFESMVHALLRVLRKSQGRWDAREQRGVAAYARGLQLLLSGYGKDIHEVRRNVRQVQYATVQCSAVQYSTVPGVITLGFDKSASGIRTLSEKLSRVHHVAPGNPYP